jgi:serine protease
MTAVVLTGAALALGTPSSGHKASTAETGGHGNDRFATVGKSEGPASKTKLGLPPLSEHAVRRADHLEKAHPKASTEELEEEELENGAASSPTSTAQLVYHGNAVQTSPRVYLVLWGPTWGTSTGDPYGVANRLHYFYQGVGGSSFANALKQFGGSTGAFTNPVGQYKGWIQDTTAVPSRPTKQDVANAAARAAVRLNDLNYNAQYIIATPWGALDQYSISNNFCAWHNWTGVTGRTGWATYTSMPYIPYEDYLGRGCGKGKVNGANGLLDGVTILASHEYAESVNNPGLNAWYDVDGSENADKCSWVNLANKTLSNGYTFPVQPYWSNSYRSTYGNGCLYSS